MQTNPLGPRRFARTAFLLHLLNHLLKYLLECLLNFQEVGWGMNWPKGPPKDYTISQYSPMSSWLPKPLAQSPTGVGTESHWRWKRATSGVGARKYHLSSAAIAQRQVMRQLGGTRRVSKRWARDRTGRLRSRAEMQRLEAADQAYLDAKAGRRGGYERAATAERDEFGRFTSTTDY